MDLNDGRTVALVESFGNGEPIESPKRVSDYNDMFDVAKLEALPPDESLSLIRRYREEHEND